MAPRGDESEVRGDSGRTAVVGTFPAHSLLVLIGEMEKIVKAWRACTSVGQDVVSGVANAAITGGCVAPEFHRSVYLVDFTVQLTAYSTNSHTPLHMCFIVYVHYDALPPTFFRDVPGTSRTGICRSCRRRCWWICGPRRGGRWTRRLRSWGDVWRSTRNCWTRCESWASRWLRCTGQPSMANRRRPSICACTWSVPDEQVCVWIISGFRGSDCV